jgi:hypothetical protein
LKDQATALASTQFRQFEPRHRRIQEGKIMPSAKIIPYVLSILGLCALGQRIASQTPEQTGARSKRMVIAASAVLDGKGRVLHDTRIVVEGSKIVGMDPKAGVAGLD